MHGQVLWIPASSSEAEDCVTWTLNDKLCSIYCHKMYHGLMLSLWMRNIPPKSSLSSSPNSGSTPGLWPLSCPHKPTLLASYSFWNRIPPQDIVHRIYSPASQSKTLPSTLILPFIFLSVREDQTWMVFHLVAREITNVLTLNYGFPSSAEWWVGTHGRRVAKQRQISPFAQYCVVAPPMPKW